MRLILAGKKETVRPLIANKLMNIIEEVDDLGVPFYPLANDVPYVADTIGDSMERFPVELRLPYPTTLALNVMQPLIAQSLADKILVHLAVAGRLPAGYTEYSAQDLGQRLYEICAWGHPDKSLQLVLGRLALNVPVWVKALPRFSRKMSLVL